MSAEQFARAQALAATKGSRILAQFSAERQAIRAMQAARSMPLPGRGARGPFTAATHDRLTASWLAGQRAINDELRGDLDAIALRCVQQDPAARYADVAALQADHVHMHAQWQRLRQVLRVWRDAEAPPAVTDAERAAWWADGSGIPPVGLG